MDEPARDDSDEAIAAIADPIERAVRLRAVAKERGTLTPTQSAMYRSAIAELRGDNERNRSWIARRLKISPTRISQLLAKPKKAATEGASV